MGWDVASAEASARVRSAKVRRDVTCTLVEGSAYLVVAPRCSPRLWKHVTDQVVEGFEAGAAAGGAPDAMLQQGSAHATQRLLALRDQLVEPSIALDAQIGAVVVTGDGVHVALTGGIRIYRARGRVPDRLFARTPRPVGLTAGAPFVAREPWQPGDLFLVGTHDAFTVRTIANVASVLARGNATARQVADALIAPCRDDGNGACITVLRPG